MNVANSGLFRDVIEHVHVLETNMCSFSRKHLIFTSGASRPMTLTRRVLTLVWCFIRATSLLGRPMRLWFRRSWERIPTRMGQLSFLGKVIRKERTTAMISNQCRYVNVDVWQPSRRYVPIAQEVYIICIYIYISIYIIYILSARWYVAKKIAMWTWFSADWAWGNRPQCDS